MKEFWKRFKEEWVWQHTTLVESGFYDQVALPWVVGIVVLAAIEFILWIYSPFYGSVKQSLGLIFIALWSAMTLLATVDMCYREIQTLNFHRKLEGRKS